MSLIPKTMTGMTVPYGCCPMNSYVSAMMDPDRILDNEPRLKPMPQRLNLYSQGALSSYCGPVLLYCGPMLLG